MTEAMVFSRISFGRRRFRFVAEFIFEQNSLVVVQACCRSALTFPSRIQDSDSGISGDSAVPEPGLYEIMGSEDGSLKKNGSVLLNNAIPRSHLGKC